VKEEMKKYVFISLVLVLGIYFLGCGKKQQTLEEMQAPMSIESMGQTAATETKAAPEVKAPEVTPPAVQATPEAAASKLEALPPSGPYKPTTEQIQTALKNAGF
jgi:hypothetical protein